MPSYSHKFLTIFSILTITPFLVENAYSDITLNAGDGNGVDVAVESGSIITLEILYHPPTDGPICFSGVGLDVSWSTSGNMDVDFGPANPGGFFRAGQATNVPGAIDVFSGAGISDGAALTNLGVPPASGKFNVGGGGHFDVAGGAAGISYGVPTGTQPLELMSVELVVSGNPGSTATFFPSGTVIKDEFYPTMGAGGMFEPNGGTYTVPFLSGVAINVGSSVDPVLESLTVTIAGKTLIGDINCDGMVNLLDVQPFVQLLSTGEFSEKADINQDGVVDLLDVAPFIEILEP